MEFSSSQIAGALGGQVVGEDHAVNNIAGIETAGVKDLTFINDAKYVPLLEQSHAGVVLISKDIPFEPSEKHTFIVVDNARLALGQILTLVEQTLRPRKSGCEEPSYVAQGVCIPDDAYIGAYTYIAEGVSLGTGVQLYPHVYVGENVTIGAGTILYDGVKIYAGSTIGERCILHAGVVIGADGFGFEPDAQGVNHKIPQIGNVVIGNDVEIGANSTIDRGALGNTVVHDNVKIDNLVMVGHNCEIGEGTILCGQVGLAGSTVIGKHCILAGQAGVAGHLSIPDGTILGAQTGVTGTIKQSGMYCGSPAMEASLWRRAMVMVRNLPRR